MDQQVSTVIRPSVPGMCQFRALALLAAIALSPPAWADMPRGWRVVDGDTIHDSQRYWRTVGFDAPEMSGREAGAGQRAARFLEDRIRRAGSVVMVDLGECDNRRFNRRLGVLLLDGRDAADIMVEAGHAERRPVTRGVVCR